MLCSISTPYSNFVENDNKNQMIIEQIRIVLPALFIKAKTFSATSFTIYFKLGTLYSGSSDI